MDLSRLKQRLKELALLVLGVALLCVLILVYRGGTEWFTSSDWSAVSSYQWTAIGFITVVFLCLQYFVLILLRMFLVRNILLWGLPALWLLLNGIITLQRLFQSEAGETLTGWIPLTDLFGWMLAAVYFPFLIGGGAIVAIIDSAGPMLTQACQAAQLSLQALGASEWDVLGWMVDYAGQFWDLITQLFMNQVRPQAGERPFLDISLRGMFSLPYWFYSIGYSLSCLV